MKRPGPRMSSVTARMGLFTWLGGPTLAAVVGLLLYVTPVRILGIMVPMPLFPLMAIFFWAMARPQLMPPVVVFLIGLFQDLLTGGPLGLWAFAYLIGYAVMSTQADGLMGRSRGMLWMAFGFMVVLTLAAAALAGSLIAGDPPQWASLFAQGIATFLIYPVMSRLFDGVLHATSQARRAYSHHNAGVL